jgi:Protein of unknown function (DUF3309)
VNELRVFLHRNDSETEIAIDILWPCQRNGFVLCRWLFMAPIQNKGPAKKNTLNALMGCELGEKESMSIILLVLLILLVVGALPSWPHSRSWGYYPSGGLGLILVIVLLVVLLR